MLTPALAVPAPTPEQVRLAWTRTLAQLADSGSGPADERARRLGTLLDGLALIAAERVRDAADEPLTLAGVVARVAAEEAAAGWQAEVARGGAPERRPFLPELARRVLALGHLGAAYQDEAPLLDPRCTAIDPDCADAPLALVRAVVSVELQSAELLAVIVARHLHWRAQEESAGRPQPLTPWLGTLLEDTTAQCLLVAALAGEALPETKRLWRRLETAAVPDWPAGPLAACCALGRLLRSPHEAGLLAEFTKHVAGWPGWQDEDAWPIRHPGTDLGELKTRLTERGAVALGVAERKPWPRGALAQALAGCWPALLSFCFLPTSRALGEGGPADPPQGRGERDEPHP